MGNMGLLDIFRTIYAINLNIVPLITATCNILVKSHILISTIVI